LLFEVMDSVQKQLVPMLDQIHDASGSATQKLHAFVKSYVRHTVDNRKAVGIFLKEFDSLSPKRRKKITESRDLYDKFVFDLLKEGRDAGEFSDDTYRSEDSLQYSGRQWSQKCHQFHVSFNVSEIIVR